MSAFWVKRHCVLGYETPAHEVLGFAAAQVLHVQCFLNLPQRLQVGVVQAVHDGPEAQTEP